MMPEYDLGVNIWLIRIYLVTILSLSHFRTFIDFVLRKQLYYTQIVSRIPIPF